MKLTGVRAAILDIEGTVGSIRYVKDVLFPYAAQRYRGWFDGLGPAEQARWSQAVGTEGSAVVSALERWTAADVKHPVLKAVQAQIWHAGFAAGDLQGSVYADVEPALRRWRAAGVAVYIYSSGAEAAQRDWFGHSERGDLTPLLDGYFDLDSAGGKLQSDSYRLILRRIGVEAASPEAAVFFSDVPAELDAAVAVGLRAVLVVRTQQTGAASAFRGVSDFAAIDLERIP
jgi:enolase-phosphatase E1